MKMDNLVKRQYNRNMPVVHYAIRFSICIGRFDRLIAIRNLIYMQYIQYI